MSCPRELTTAGGGWPLARFEVAFAFTLSAAALQCKPFMISVRTWAESWFLHLILVAVAALLWWWHPAAGAAALLLLVFNINFFRDPERQIPADPRAVVSPADGKVVEVRAAREEKFIGGEATMVAIFLNVFDVHVNRAPIDGEVKISEHVPGKFLNAMRAARTARSTTATRTWRLLRPRSRSKLNASCS